MYPGGGTRYQKHVDNPRLRTASAVDNRRRITVLYYLNRDWRSLAGGCLRLHNTAPPEDIEPAFNRVVFFLSELVLHEVLPTNDARLAVTVWLSEMQEPETAAEGMLQQIFRHVTKGHAVPAVPAKAPLPAATAAGAGMDGGEGVEGASAASFDGAFASLAATGQGHLAGAGSGAGEPAAPPTPPAGVAGSTVLLASAAPPLPPPADEDEDEDEGDYLD